MRRTCFLALALLAFVAISCKPEPQGKRALVTCPFIAQAPTIDGRIGKNEWRGTPAAAPFFDVVTKTQGPVATRARVAFNNDCLYVSFVCEDPEGVFGRLAPKIQLPVTDEVHAQLRRRSFMAGKRDGEEAYDPTTSWKSVLSSAEADAVEDIVHRFRLDEYLRK